MSLILTLSKTDVRNIFREQILYVMFVVAPVMQFVLARFLVPWLATQFPGLLPYYPIILLLVTLQVVTGIGFVISSIMLDERDEEVLTALRTLPMSTYFFLSYRLLFAMSVAFLFALAMIMGTGLVKVSWQAGAGVAFIFSLITPIVLLIMTTFSRNKVEGLAVFKGLNLILLLPVASFFIPAPYHYFFGIAPTYWSFQAFDRMLSGEPALLYWGLAIVFHLILILILVDIFRRRVFT